jgi:hypothetical protein
MSTNNKNSFYFNQHMHYTFVVIYTPTLPLTTQPSGEAYRTRHNNTAQQHATDKFTSHLRRKQDQLPIILNVLTKKENKRTYIF